MARTCRRVPYKASFKSVKDYVERFLSGEGFSQKDYQGEQVWKKGTGLMTAMEYIKVEFTENEVVLYAWVQAGIGNVGGKEMDLTGIVGSLPKKKLSTRLDQLESIIRSL